MATDLPRALRRTLVERLDFRLTAVVGLSLMGHAGCVGYLRTLDAPELPLVVATQPVRYRMPPPLLPPPRPMPVVAAAPAKRAPATGTRTPRLSRDDVRSSPLLRALGGRHATDEVLAAGASVDSAFDGVVAANDNAAHGLTSRHDSDGARLRHGGEVPFAGPDSVSSGEAHERTLTPPGVRPPPPPPPVKLVGLPSLMSALRPLQRALGRCYERQLKLTGPGLRGRVELTLDLAADGAVRDARVTHNTSGDLGLEVCFRDVLTQAHFPPGTAARVVIPLQLIEK